MYVVVDTSGLKQSEEYPKALYFSKIKEAQEWIENVKSNNSLLTAAYFIFHVPHPDKQEYISLFKTKNQGLFEKRDELEKLPYSLLCEMASIKFLSVKAEFRQLFEQNKIDLELYPKISKAFEFERYKSFLINFNK